MSAEYLMNYKKANWTAASLALDSFTYFNTISREDYSKIVYHHIEEIIQSSNPHHIIKIIKQMSQLNNNSFQNLQVDDILIYREICKAIYFDNLLIV